MTDMLGRRCSVHIIPADAFNKYDATTGKFVDELSWCGAVDDKHRLLAVAMQNIVASGRTIMRGDLVEFEQDGGYRQTATFVWNGKQLFGFRDDGESEFWDYPSYPLVAHVSIDEFPSLHYYENADLYNQLFWLDTRGYERSYDLLINHTKRRKFRMSRKFVYELLPLYSCYEPWLPFDLTEDEQLIELPYDSQ